MHLSSSIFFSWACLQLSKTASWDRGDTWAVSPGSLCCTSPWILGSMVAPVGLVPHQTWSRLSMHHVERDSKCGADSGCSLCSFHPWVLSGVKLGMSQMMCSGIAFSPQKPSWICAFSWGSGHQRRFLNQGWKRRWVVKSEFLVHAGLR